MKTKAQIIEAIQMCEASEPSLDDDRSKLANHVAQDVLNWVLDRPCGFTELMEGFQADLKELHKEN
jgi:hypothetical protein